MLPAVQITLRRGAVTAQITLLPIATRHASGKAAAAAAAAASKAGGAHNFVFLGPPGVGKGTFAARVATKLGIPAISTGDIIRAEIKAGSALGGEIKAYSDSGRLVPDEVVNTMVRKRLSQPDAAKGYILDGYPRTLEQAKTLDGHQRVSRVLNIALPEHVLLAKMLARRVCADCGRGYNIASIKEGDLDMPPLLPKPSDCDRCHGKPRLVIRDDDKEEVVKARFAIYRDSTAPLIDYYAATGKLQTFDVKKGLDDTPRLFKELGI